MQLGETFSKYVVKAGEALIGLVTNAIDAQDHLNDLSTRLGITAVEAGGLGFAARQAGSDLEVAAQAMGRLEVSASKADAGDKKLSKIFQDLGISVRDSNLKMKDGLTLLIEVADAFNKYADGPKKAELAQVLMSRSWQQLMPLLGDGGQKLRENLKYFDQYSGVTNQATKNSDQFNDQVEKLRLLQSRLGNALATELVPPMTTVVNKMIEFSEKSTFAKTAAEALASIFEKLAIGFANDAVSLEILLAKFDSLTSRMQAFDVMEKTAREAFFSGDIKGWLGAITGLQAQYDAISKRTDERIAKARADRDQFVADMQSQKILAMFTPDPFKRGAGEDKPDAPSVGGDSKKVRETTLEIERLIKQLDRQVVSLENADSASRKYEETLERIAEMTAKERGTPEQQAAALSRAKQFDAIKIAIDSYKQSVKLLVDEETRQIEAVEKEQAAWEKFKASLTGDKAFEDTIKAEERLRLETEQTIRAIQNSGLDPTVIAEKIAAAQALLARQIQGLWKTTEGVAEDATSRMRADLDDLAKSIDQTIGSALQSAMEGHFENIGQAFRRMVADMIVRATTADLMNRLFGQEVGGVRSGGGWVDAFMRLIGFPTARGVGSGAAAGAGAANGQWDVLPSASPSGVTVVNNIASGVSRNEIAALMPQLVNQTKVSVMSAMRRPGWSGA